MDSRLLSDRFPRSNEYHPDWVAGACSGGANALWLTEWLTGDMDLRPAMRVLDLGCGRAMSSIFLRREFGVEVWATDLWFNASENMRRIRDAGVDNAVYPIHADARSLPFADDFFDAIISIDSFMYYGTDDLYLNYVARFLKPGGVIGIAQAGLLNELDGAVPDVLREWWEPGMCCLHSAEWWRRQWEKTGIVEVALADSMADGWRFWIEWQRVVAPHNEVELRAVEADRGTHLGYVRAVGRRRADVKLDDPLPAIPAKYEAQPLLRGDGGGCLSSRDADTL